MKNMLKVFIVGMFFLLITQTVNAKAGEEETLTDGSGRKVYTLEAYEDAKGDFVFGPTLLGKVASLYETDDDLVEMLKVDTKDFDVINNSDKSVFKLFVTIGIILAIAYFCIELNRTVLMQGGDFTLKSFYAPFIKFVIGILMIMLIIPLIEIYANFNNALINQVAEANSAEVQAGVYTCNAKSQKKLGFSDGFLAENEGEKLIVTDSSGNNEKLDPVMKQIGDMGLLERLGSIITAMLVELGALIAGLIMMYQAVSRKIEMVLRSLFFPLSAGDVFEGNHSGMIKYYKKMIALALTGVGMMMIITIGTSVQNSTFSSDAVFQFTNLKSALMLLLVPLAEAGMCSTIKTVCNEAMGV